MLYHPDLTEIRPIMAKRLAGMASTAEPHREGRSHPAQF